MADIAGKDSYVSLAGTDVSTYCDSATFERLRTLVETPAFADAGMTRVGALLDTRLQLGGTYDDATGATTLTGILNTAITATSTALIFGPSGSTSGDERFTVTMLLESYSVTSDAAGKGSWTATFQRNDATTTTERDTF